jgi:hypothetical protein
LALLFSLFRLEAQQRVRAERIADCDVSRIAPRAMSTRPIRGTLFRGSKMHQRPPRYWNLFGHSPPGWARVLAICDFVHNHITFGYAEITGAVACRNVHAAAKCDGEVPRSKRRHPLAHTAAGRPIMQIRVGYELV